MEFTLKENEKAELYLDSNSDPFIIFNLNDSSQLKVFEYNFDTSKKRIINLKGLKSNLEYHYSTYNINDNEYVIEVNHLSNNSISNVYNHGINEKNNKLSFNVTGSVLKNISGCTTNQENQIINLLDGKSVIEPNLLIDNFDISSSHSAYIGRFKDESLFYLMSKGLTKNNAVSLLIKSILLNSGDDTKKEFLELIELIKGRDDLNG